MIKFNILHRLGIQTYAMAQKQGSVGKFILYTLDNELSTEKPHLHICIKSDGKEFKGKILRNHKGLKTIGKIFLRKDCNFTLQNLEIESDNQFTTKEKKSFIDWLNKKEVLNSKNGKIALMDYLKSNGFGLFKEEFEGWENS